MPGSEVVFVVVGAIGFSILSLTLLLGELFEHEIDVSHGVEQ
jgi:hypothetical protein